MHDDHGTLAAQRLRDCAGDDFAWRDDPRYLSIDAVATRTHDQATDAVRHEFADGSAIVVRRSDYGLGVHRSWVDELEADRGEFSEDEDEDFVDPGPIAFAWAQEVAGHSGSTMIEPAHARPAPWCAHDETDADAPSPRLRRPARTGLRLAA